MTPAGYHWHDNGHATYLVSGSVEQSLRGRRGEYV